MVWAGDFSGYTPVVVRAAPTIFQQLTRKIYPVFVAIGLTRIAQYKYLYYTKFTRYGNNNTQYQNNRLPHPF